MAADEPTRLLLRIECGLARLRTAAFLLLCHFGAAALALWLVLAFWVGLFGVLARFSSFGTRWAVVVIPVLWTGLEYFRSEVYYLRFSWLNAGYAFSNHVQTVPFKLLGVYGLGFLLMLLAATVNYLATDALAADVKRRRLGAWPATYLGIKISASADFQFSAEAQPHNLILARCKSQELSSKGLVVNFS